MPIIIDRTKESKNKSSPNRDKFIKRAKNNIKKSIKKYITDEADIKSISNGKDKRVRVSNKSLDEPQIVHSPHNVRKHVYVGNKNYVAGDEIEKDNEESSSSGSGPGELMNDDFYFTLSHEEFLQLFFDDLELPDLIKKQLISEEDFQTKPAGFTADGPPSRLDLLRTMKNSLKRKYSIFGSIEEELEKYYKQLEETESEEDKLIIQLKIDDLLKQKNNIPFIQDLDLRYRKTEIVPIPVTRAVMFCLMDVSGSMSEWHKEMAKRFFMILYLFLTKQYEHVDIVFVKHHHEAFEVDEDNFFYSPESGGTIVSSGLDMINTIINERFNKPYYNVYISHCSDGDSWRDDDEAVITNMRKLLNKTQYYAYIDIDRKDGHENPIYALFGVKNTNTTDEDSDLIKIFTKIKEDFPKKLSEKLQLRHITDASHIYDVFRSLFEKKLS